MTRFAIDDAYAARFPVQVVGAGTHEELWVPAEELAEFNRHLVGVIEVVASYYGERFADAKPTLSGLIGDETGGPNPS